ncbi:cysteinyl-tRNA synthetase CysS [Phaeobacter piscinae]|uniref:Cysteine--tRNA ligase n=1 Tax=Phaeobacter piscinae TaxID=1580596 RepID=A0AAN1LAI9_9RHOB|nr:cysteine--tRNA ligase [Phaeobacter piscinae]ATG43484.1 cysteinyl-tRNA synthetase CysS [Phaeobacter piscinae]AUR35861.1 cysteinyl-tRNA synthetase CysS [Phaeobacter piscinae]
MTTIKLHNTRTRGKEVLDPLNPDDVRLYLCGPTVYDRAHLGNARPVVVFDVLYRLLRQVYGTNHVTYARNFTDVDDKINATALARKEAGAPGTLEELVQERTEETISWYLADMAELGALEPDHMPRATAYIPQMIAMIEDLIAKDHAYADGAGHVLFAVKSYKDYGALSGRSVDDMIAGARVEVADNKRDPMDFVLWKPSTDELPGWDSPWGRGRPGWHIECSAMSHELFGDSFDIHGGGNDLMFPHHENEIAQSCCAHPEGDFAKIWLHNEMLQVEGKKMSKSLGNFFTVRDLLDQGYPGEVIRLVFLQTHYRKPMDWTDKKAKEAEKELRKWRKLTAGVSPGEVHPGVLENLGNDLNTSAAIGNLRWIANEIEHLIPFQKMSDANDPTAPELTKSPDHWRSVLLASANLMGLLTDELGAWTQDEDHDLSHYENKLSEARQLAMETKNFAEVDRLKSTLLDAGVEVRMSKTGVELVPGPSFDASKLDAI